MTTPLKVLIIEDSEDDLLLLLRELKRGGYQPDYKRVENQEEMVHALDSQKWDIILSDYSLPRFSGLAALDLYKKYNLDNPFIVISGMIGEGTAVEMMKAGASDYLMKGNLTRLAPAIERELREAEVRRERRRGQEQIRLANIELSHAYDSTLEGWSRALELRERETAGHSQRVVTLTLELARKAGINEGALVDVRRGALLHDIGKMGIPDSILLKPGPLSDEEWIIMRYHPVYAFRLLEPISYLHSSLDIPYCHHEKWDGSGYPRGLKGSDIPLAARIFAIVDVWDALTSDRSYRPAWDREAALKYMASQSGKHFDPEIVKYFFEMIQKSGDGKLITTL